MRLHVEVFKQTTDYTCGPAALKTFLHYYNRDEYTEEQLDKLLNTCPIKGTKIEVIYTFLRSIGVDVATERSDSNIDVISLLNAGCIILTEWIEWGGHFVIINGYDDTHYYLADPEEGNIKVLKDKFHSMWFTKQESFANMLYLQSHLT